MKPCGLHKPLARDSNSPSNNGFDEYFMQRAVILALKGKGKTSPNPVVGCVIVKAGKILAEGYHRKAGAPHAERIALRKISAAEARGATLYVTLEPCSIRGKTPPCVPAIVSAGIRRVVAACRDPNPKVNGRGIAWLKKEGVSVTEGVLRETCERLNRPFEKFIRRGVPYVTLKAALTLDGKIATAGGESKWISNAASRRRVHKLRREADAILVGSATVRADDPRLDVRLPGKKGRKNPAVVVLSAGLDLPTGGRLFAIKGRRLIVATRRTASEKKRRALIRKGAEIWSLKSDGNGGVDLRDLLKRLGREGMTHLLVEGGAKVYSAFVSRRLADRLVLFVAPKLLGGGGLDWLPGLRIPTIKKALKLEDVSTQMLGDNILIEAEL